MLAIILASASIIIALACVVTGRRDLARISRALGRAVVACGCIAIIASIAMTWSDSSAPGLSQADRQRMISSAVPEAADNAILTILVAAPALMVGHWIFRKKDARSE